MQPATAGDVVTIDDSYNGNPDGARVAIEFLAGLKGHRRIYVTPGFSETGSKSAEVHRQTGRQLAEAGIEVVALVKNSVTPHIAEGLEEAGFKGELIWYPDGMSSLVALPKLTVAGDVVLLQNDWGDQYA
jgi:UDP-N-acetylmuramoyl-tripeptide--D-alanyl-D-alanine ligase